MAKLYFRYGAMGSSKTANALMVAYNYKERGKKVLLAKPKLDTREVGVMHSRIGLEQHCIYVEDLVEKSLDELNKYDCIIVDEAQFCKKEDVKFFTRLVFRKLPGRRSCRKERRRLCKEKRSCHGDPVLPGCDPS